MTQRRGFRFPTSSVRRKSSWQLGPATTNDGESQVVTSSLAQVASSAVAVLEDGLTFVRLRGELTFFLTDASALANGFNGAFGIGIATLAAFTAGAASLPTPITEQTWDGWMYHRYFSVLSAGSIAAATAAQEALQVSNVSAALRIEVDSKVMRKVAVDEVMYAAIEVIETGTLTMRWSLNSRTLVKLP